MGKPFEEALRITRRNLDRMNNEYQAILAAYLAGNIEKAYESAFSFALSSEAQALLARDLPAYTGKPKAHQRMKQQIRELFPVIIEEVPDQNMIYFTFPALLPKKEKGNSFYIRSSLHIALMDYFRDKPPLRIRECVIVVCHRYDRDRPERAYRDHDNIELNAVIDTIALFSLVDDSPHRCDHFYYSSPSDHNATEISILPRERFIEWLGWLDALRKINKNVI